jgi:hypothetical protein
MDFQVMKSIIAPDNVFLRTTHDHHSLLWQLGVVLYNDGDRGEAYLQSCCNRIQTEVEHLQPLFNFFVLSLLGLDRQDAAEIADFGGSPILQLLLISACFGVGFDVVVVSAVLKKLLNLVGDGAVRSIQANESFQVFHINALHSNFLVQRYGQAENPTQIRMFARTPSTIHVLVNGTARYGQGQLLGPTFPHGIGPFAIQNMELSCAAENIPCVPLLPTIGSQPVDRLLRPLFPGERTRPSHRNAADDTALETDDDGESNSLSDPDDHSDSKWSLRNAAAESEASEDTLSGNVVASGYHSDGSTHESREAIQAQFSGMTSTELRSGTFLQCLRFFSAVIA